MTRMELNQCVHPTGGHRFAQSGLDRQGRLPPVADAHGSDGFSMRFAYMLPVGFPTAGYPLAINRL